MRRAVFLLAFALLAAQPLTAAILTEHVVADDCPMPPVTPVENPARVPAGLVSELLTWIGQASDYDVTEALADPPSVTFCPPGEIIAYEDTALRVGDDIRGAYDWPGRRVILVEPWDASRDRDVSVLLHELIHHVQLGARDWECVGAPEWEAYKLQERWLAARGIDPEFDWLQIYMISRCPSDVHP